MVSRQRQQPNELLRVTIRMISALVVMAATAAILFWMNAQLSLFAVAAMPLLVWRALHFGRRARPLSLAIQSQLAALTTRLEQNLRGARVVKAFAQEEAEIERFDRENEKWFDVSSQQRPAVGRQSAADAADRQPGHRLHPLVRRYAGQQR